MKQIKTQIACGGKRGAGGGMKWVLTEGDGYLLLSFSPKRRLKQTPRWCWSIWVMTVSWELFEIS